MRHGDDSQHGIVLAAVLMILAILSVMAATSIEISHTEQQIARNMLHQTQAKALADSGITLSLIALLTGSSGEPWPRDGTFRTISFGGINIDVSIQDELGKIDINAASDDILRSLFLSLGVNADSADADVDAIADWRDVDNLKHLHGVENDDYQAAGFSYGPRNGLFESVLELEQVKGILREVVTKARPLLTVYSRHPFPDPSSAPRSVLIALPEINTARIDSLISARQEASLKKERPSATNGGATVFDLVGRAFTLTARVKTDSGASVSRTTVVRFTGSPDRPYWVLDVQ